MTIGGVGVGAGVACTGGGSGRSGGSGVLAQPASTRATTASRLRRIDNCESMVMWILFLEAGVAFFLLAFIVWWTMFSGRRRGERDDES
jgi:hypothetical protein